MGKKWKKWKQRRDALTGASATDNTYHDSQYGEVQAALAKMEARADSSTANVTTLANGYTPSQPSGTYAGNLGTTSFGGRGGWSTCSHNGIKQVAQIGESKIHIGGIYALQSVHGIELLVQCTDGKVHTAREDAVIPDRYAKLREYMRGGPKDTIIIPWPDGGLPPVQPEFWGELERLLPAGKVVFACIGGHGRSGTALAAMLIQHFKCTAQYAIRLVRQNHCDDAIETHGQEKYLEYFARWLAEKEGWTDSLNKAIAMEERRADKHSKAKSIPAKVEDSIPTAGGGSVPVKASEPHPKADAEAEASSQSRLDLELARANADSALCKNLTGCTGKYYRDVPCDACGAPASADAVDTSVLRDKVVNTSAGDKIPAWELSNGSWAEIELCADCGERTTPGEPCGSCAGYSC